MPSSQSGTARWEKTPPRETLGGVGSASRRSAAGDGRKGITMAAKRRGHGEGTIKQRADGLWEARVSLEGGKRRSFYGKTRREAQDKLRGALRDIDAGLDLSADRQTVA